jgi:hypothetical protein
MPMNMGMGGASLHRDGLSGCGGDVSVRHPSHGSSLFITEDAAELWSGQGGEPWMEGDTASGQGSAGCVETAPGILVSVCVF